jgi:hypothetical protein
MSAIGELGSTESVDHQFAISRKGCEEELKEKQAQFGLNGLVNRPAQLLPVSVMILWKKSCYPTDNTEEAMASMHATSSNPNLKTMKFKGQIAHQY